MKGIRVRTDKHGIRAWLFDLEADVMEIAWAEPKVSVSGVHEELESSRVIAYTTVMTTMVRLRDKKLLVRERDGKRYLYRAAMTRDEFLQQMADEVLDSLAEAGFDNVASLLVGRLETTNDEELDRLDKLIRRRREELDQ